MMNAQNSSSAVASALRSGSVSLEPFALWCLNYIIIPFSAGVIMVVLVHQLLLLYWDLRDQGHARRQKRELYNHLHRNLQERLREPIAPPGSE
jgi:hypothetical protein